MSIINLWSLGKFAKGLLYQKANYIMKKFRLKIDIFLGSYFSQQIIQIDLLYIIINVIVGKNLHVRK